MRAPVVLAWRAAPSARYYNVQLHRDGVKVLTAWPRKPQFRDQTQLALRRKRHRSARASYTWYVWPGLGSREQPRYGKLLGSSRFVVKR